MQSSQLRQNGVNDRQSGSVAAEPPLMYTLDVSVICPYARAHVNNARMSVICPYLVRNCCLFNARNAYVMCPCHSAIANVCKGVVLAELPDKVVSRHTIRSNYATFLPNRLIVCYSDSYQLVNQTCTTCTEFRPDKEHSDDVMFM